MKTKRSTKKWIILLILVGVAIGFYFLWSGSLFGKRLPIYSGGSVQTFTPLVNENVPNSTAEVAVVTPMAALATPITLSTPTAIPASVKPVCGQREPMILLGLGIDENEQADVIRLVRIDFIERKILVLSIPRDFWVPIPNMAEHNITHFKINAAYGYGEYYNGPGQGVVEFANTIYQNYGISFDRYVVFHFSNFEEMIDTVGGVDIVLDAPIGAYGIVGKTHLDGATALTYAQNRNADNDLFRVKRQSEILKGLFGKIVQPENIVKLPGLGLKFLADKSIITDLSLQDVATFTCLAGELNTLSLIFRDIPPEFYQAARTNTGRFIFIPSSQVDLFIKDMIMNGNY